MVDIFMPSCETFKTTFDEYTAPDDMAKFLQEDYETDKLLAEINNLNSHFFFLMVARSGGLLKSKRRGCANRTGQTDFILAKKLD